MTKNTQIYLEIVRCLIDQTNVDINAKGINGKTLLHFAIELDELSLVELLLSKKSINPLIEDEKGKSSLDYAKDVRRKETLQALIDAKYGSEEDSLLHLAAVMGEANAVRFLINNGVKANIQNSLLHTPLHLAAGMGHEKVIEVLVREGNADKDTLDARNHAPIHYAVNNKRIGAVKLLLDLGASASTIGRGKGSMKLSPVHVAVSCSNYDERNLCLDIVKCLINAPDSYVNSQDYENKTPLHYADKLKTIETLLTREDIDPLIKDDVGKTPFCYAKEANRLDIVKVLVGNKYGLEKNSLLHLAAKKGYVELIDGILNEGIEANALNKNGESAAYLAAKNGHLDVVKLLLKRGADATDVFQHAIRLNNKKLIKLLLKEKNIVLFGKCDNFPTFHMLSNKYLKERKIADKRVKRYSNIIHIIGAICAVGLVVIYPHIGIAIGMFALIVAVIMSNLTQKYIEEEFQKKMSIELESEKGSESESERKSETSVLSDVEIENIEEGSIETREEQAEVSSRCRQHGI